MKSAKEDPDVSDRAINRLSYKGKLAMYSKTSGWALCVGAGVSRPFFPDWEALATSLLQKNTNPTISEENATKMVKEFGAAPAIQAAAKIHGDLKTFPTRISAVLYEVIKRDIEREDSGSWKKVVSKALCGASPRSLRRKEDWSSFVENLRRVAKNHEDKGSPPCSAFGIAEAIANVAGTENQPQAILSFNAEPLLFSLINAFYAQAPESEAYTVANMRPVEHMFHDLSQRHSGQIPYFYIHGIVPIPDQSATFGKAISSEKLIFSEEQYLSLSNRAYSWQSANFLSTCLNYRCVFAGVSFTDPNLRRWLAWQHESRTQVRRSKLLPTERKQHFWFKKDKNAGKPRLTSDQQLLQASMDHLGVRIIWIKEYTEIGERLDEMLTLTTNS